MVEQYVPSLSTHTTFSDLIASCTPIPLWSSYLVHCALTLASFASTSSADLDYKCLTDLELISIKNYGNKFMLNQNNRTTENPVQDLMTIKSVITSRAQQPARFAYLHAALATRNQQERIDAVARLMDEDFLRVAPNTKSNSELENHSRGSRGPQVPVGRCSTRENQQPATEASARREITPPINQPEAGTKAAAQTRNSKKSISKESRGEVAAEQQLRSSLARETDDTSHPPPQGRTAASERSKKFGSPNSISKKPR